MNYQANQQFAYEQHAAEAERLAADAADGTDDVEFCHVERLTDARELHVYESFPPVGIGTVITVLVTPREVRVIEIEPKF